MACKCDITPFMDNGMTVRKGNGRGISVIA